MSKGGLKLALPLVLAHEGGFSNHPADPGGATMKGVTQAVYDAYRSGEGADHRSVRLIADAELNAIYREQYWSAIQGDKLPAGIDYAVFDFAVNSGAAQAIKELQRVVGAGVDGRIGLKTIKAVCAAAAKDEEAVIEAYCDRRLAFMKKLKNWPSFKKGWTARVAGVRSYALRIARDDLAYPIPKEELPPPLPPEAVAKAEPAETAVLKTEAGKGAMVTGGGVAVTGVGTLAKFAEVQDKADQVGGAASSVTAATEAVQSFFGLDFQVLLLMGLAGAGVGLVYLLFQLGRTQKEKA